MSFGFATHTKKKLSLSFPPPHPTHLDKHRVVDLAQAQQLQHFAGLGVEVVDAADADDQGDARLRVGVEAAGRLGFAAQADEVGLL